MSDLYDNDFERFLQQQVKHHRMYPSDAVWKGIYKQMHGDRKWPGLYFFAIVTVALLTICTIFIESQPIIYAPQPIAKVITSGAYDQLNPAASTVNTFKRFNDGRLVQDHIGPNAAAATAEDASSMALLTPANSTTNVIIASETVTLNTGTPAEMESVIAETVVAAAPASNHSSTSLAGSISTLSNSNTTPQQEEQDASAVAAPKDPADQYLEEHPEELERIRKQQLKSKPSRWQLQFYIAPSMNFREIVDETPAGLLANSPVSANYGVSANKVIRYTPGMGIEIGFGAMYNVKKNLWIKGALQYNIRQYNIEAYSGNTELARIALQSGNGIKTIDALSSFRTSGTVGEALLVNKYHQISFPVGLEYNLLGDGRFGINLSGSLQPTYTFSQSSSYLLSADYKSYADGRSLLRRWNLNSSLEATFSFKARNNVQWKFGPQLRYQHLPTYSDPYPIKEYLIDYGLKIGFTKTIR